MRALGQSSPLVSSLHTSAVYVLPDLDVLDHVVEGEAHGFIYARDGHPNALQLNQRLMTVTGASHGLVCSSGMGAISAVLLSLVGKGDHVLASDLLYGRTTQLFLQELSRYGVKTTFVDALSLEAVEEAFTSAERPPRAFFVETISNPLLRVIDVHQLSQIAQRHNSHLIVDNTFATPILCQPVKAGASFIIESLTKMISGHSDVTVGWVGISPYLTDGQEWLAQMTQVMSIWGFNGSPFDSWLTERGLATLELRIRKSCENARELADRLQKHPKVTRVVHPSLPSHPEHELSKRVLADFGNLLSFEVEGGREGVNHWMRAVPEIPFSPSLGHVGTTWSHPGTTSHRYDSPARRAKQGITEGLIRLSVGVEDVEDLWSLLSRVA